MSSDIALESDGIYLRFCRRVQESPNAPALIVDSQVCSYAELNERVKFCAAGMLSRGCAEGDAVASLLGSSMDFVVGALATFAIGGVLVPLNPRFQVDELRHYLGSSRPRAIVYSAALQEIVNGLELPIPLRAHCFDEFSVAADTVAIDADPHKACLYMFSSGSTGASKRITRTQAQLLAEYDAFSAAVALSPRDRVLCTLPLYHAHGFANAMMAALLSGAALVLTGGEFNARATLSAIASFGISIYPSVPFMLKMLAETRLAVMPDFSALRLVISAGAALPSDVQTRFAERFGVAISQLYGSTETGAMTINLLFAGSKPQSVGRPLPGYEFEIRAEDGRVCGAGESGEIWFQSPAMTRCYDGLANLTAEAFVDGWFFAGDMGHRDADGDLFVTGRQKLIINVAGNKVDPLEVEQVLAKHPKVAEAVVLGVPHSGTGERVKAVIVTHTPGSCSEPELIEFAEARLAPYKVPRLFEFRDEVPRNQLGKVLRKYLVDVPAAEARKGGGAC